MKLCLAGTGLLKNHPALLVECKYILESFIYVKDWQLPYFGQAELFLLDSGAFTFLRKKHKHNVDWMGYIDKYAEFINANNVKHFFELDIDSVVGYEKVKQMRNTLENKVGRQCIPVWHKERGADEYRGMAKDYDYIALGGIAGADKNPTPERYFKTLIDIAHENGAKLHGLGYTSSKGLKKYHFDSVDSTTWVNGGRFGNICVFENGEVSQKHTKGMRCIKQNELMIRNYMEWIKFQRYAEVHL